MTFADIKRRYEAKGVKALFLGDTEWLFKEVQRLTDLISGECGLDERLKAADAGWSEWQIKARNYEAALKRISTEQFPMPTPCREKYLRDIAKKALAGSV